MYLRTCVWVPALKVTVKVAVDLGACRRAASVGVGGGSWRLRVLRPLMGTSWHLQDVIIDKSLTEL